MLCVPEPGHMILACGLSGFSHPLGTNFTSVDSYVLLPFLKHISSRVFLVLVWKPVLQPAADSRTRFGELLYDSFMCIFNLSLHEYI